MEAGWLCQSTGCPFEHTQKLGLRVDNVPWLHALHASHGMSNVDLFFSSDVHMSIYIYIDTDMCIETHFGYAQARGP